MKNEQADRSIREKLAAQASLPNDIRFNREAGWEKLAARLPETKKRTTRFFRNISIAAVLLIAVSVAAFIGYNDGRETVAIALQQPAQPIAPVQPIIPAVVPATPVPAVAKHETRAILRPVKKQEQQHAAPVPGNENADAVTAWLQANDAPDPSLCISAEAEQPGNTAGEHIDYIAF